MTDILDTVKAALARVEKATFGSNDLSRDDYDALRALVAEVKRLRDIGRKFASALPAWKAEEVVWKETEADLLRDLAVLRQRHAESVEAAYRLGWQQRATLGIGRVGETEAWLASAAKARLT